MTSPVIRLCSILLFTVLMTEHIAFAVEPSVNSGLSPQMTAYIQKEFKARAEKFASLPRERQEKLLDRAERRSEKLISKIQGWSDEKLRRRQQFALNVLNRQFKDEDVLEESERKEFALSKDEKDLFQSNAASGSAKAPEGSSLSALPLQNKAELVFTLKTNLQNIKDAKLQLARFHQKKQNRSIASAEAFVLLGLPAIAVAIGVSMIAVGIAVFVGTLGLAAGPAIALVVLGCCVLITGAVVLGIMVFSKVDGSRNFYNLSQIRWNLVLQAA